MASWAIRRRLEKRIVHMHKTILGIHTPLKTTQKCFQGRVTACRPNQCSAKEHAVMYPDFSFLRVSSSEED